MRRDIGFYVEADIKSVYQAYLNAAVNPPFERDCHQEPFHTIAFGVNYSFKYNMNGGSCNIHFMPSGNGTAVNMRFSIAQAFGARYEQYAEDLNRAMYAFLPVRVHPAEYDMDEFLKPHNQVTPASFQLPTQPAPAPVAAPAPSAAPAPVAAPAPSAAPAPGGKTCSNCGAALSATAKFCCQCGTAVPTEKTCSNCGAVVSESARFCSQCGTQV